MVSKRAASRWLTIAPSRPGQVLGDKSRVPEWAQKGRRCLLSSPDSKWLWACGSNTTGSSVASASRWSTGCSSTVSSPSRRHCLLEDLVVVASSWQELTRAVPWLGQPTGNQELASPVATPCSLTVYARRHGRTLHGQVFAMRDLSSRDRLMLRACRECPFSRTSACCVCASVAANLGRLCYATARSHAQRIGSRAMA